MIRWLGIVFVLGASLWTGACFAARERYRLKELEELQRGILFLQGQIQYLSAPLAEALGSISWKTEGEIGRILQLVSEKLEKRAGKTAEEIWNMVWEAEAPHLFFSISDLEMVRNFGKTLGYLDKEQQENHIRLFLYRIDDALHAGRKRLEKNGRLYYGVSGLCGMLLVVMLL